MKIDKIDEKILSHLEMHGRISNLDLAQAIGLSPAACLRRVRALEESGVITGYTVLLQALALGYGLTVWVEIGLASESAKALDDFERMVVTVPEVQECHLMSGDSDYLLKLLVRDLNDYERLHRRVLANLPHVAKVKSGFSIRQVCQRQGLFSLPQTPKPFQPC